MQFFKKTTFLLLASALLATACQKEVSVTDSRVPQLSGSTENFTARGFDMDVTISGNSATINTQASKTPAQSGDGIVHFASNVTPLGLSGDIFKGEDAAGKPADYELLESPSDARTYWAVPFDGTREPIKIVDAGRIIIIIGVSGCKCSGSGSSGCYGTANGGCGTVVCNYCSRDVVIIIIRSMTVDSYGVDSPYTIVAADRVDYNGKRYE